MKRVEIREPLCFSCLLLGEYPACYAFPEGIPEDIRAGVVFHTSSYPGDNGYHYVPWGKGDAE
jgi:hypothetical protein